VSPTRHNDVNGGWEDAVQVDVESTSPGLGQGRGKSSDEHLPWTDVTVRGLRHDAQRHRPVGGRTAGSL
jgi:hypothetical protein